MGHRHPRRLNGAEKAELWRRWRQGESLQTIGRALGWVTKCMHYVVAGAGSVPPRPRRRSRLALTGAEREEISRGLANGASLRAVSRRLGRTASTVSREVRRHGGRRVYRGAVADTRAWARTRRPKVCRLATRPTLRHAVAAKLALEWAPQHIAGWLRHAYPDDPEMHVSHETICLSLFVQSRGVLKKALAAHLRQRRTYRRPKCAAPRRGGGHRRRRVYSGAPRHGRGSRHARPLGRGPPRRRAPLARGHVGGTTLALRVSDSTGGTRYADRRSRADTARRATPRGIDGHADLGTRLRTRVASRVFDRDGRAGLLLRPAESVAAWDE